MAQYWFDNLGSLAKPGAYLPGKTDTLQGFSSFLPNIRGRNSSEASGSIGFTAILPCLNAADADVIIQYRYLTNPTDSGTGAGIGICFRAVDKDNFVFSGSNAQADITEWVRFAKVVGGAITWTNITDNFPKRSLGKIAYYRAKLSGSELRRCAWNDGDTVPVLGTGYSVNTTGAPASGSIGVLARAKGIDVEVLSIAVGTDGDEPPASKINNAVVSGTVYDDTGLPCSREVELYLASTGQLVGYTASDPHTGLYSIGTPWFGQEHIRIVKDDAEGVQYNHIIDRVIA